MLTKIFQITKSPLVPFTLFTFKIHCNKTITYLKKYLSPGI